MKIDGKNTIIQLTKQVKAKNEEQWKENKKNLQSRIRGNCWTIFKRLVYDYRNHFGNKERAKKQQMPYVDAEGWLYTSAALIAHAEGRSMGNRTVNRWLDALQQDESKMIDGKPFITGYKALARDCCKLKLNADYFCFMENPPISDTPTEKPPDESGRHIELSKLARKFNRKYHQR